MRYFAYGSNLDFRQMKERCPSAVFICRATLQDHKLAFTRCSSSRGCGVADVVVEKGGVVWGVVYEIQDKDVPALDRAEGFKADRPRELNSYVREQSIVWENGESARPVSTAIYVANKQSDPPLPNDEYKSLIVRGAQYWCLPERYVRDLERIESAP